MVRKLKGLSAPAMPGPGPIWGGNPSDWEGLRFAFRALESSLVQGLDELLCMKDLPSLRLFPHQEEVIRRVMGGMGGRALLADEVGLGKTIEAGVILKEYLARGMAARALILVPASLLSQWQGELHEKLGLDVCIGTRPGTWGPDLVLASIDTAKKPENSAEIWGYPYDILIVDEAHRLKESSTLNWRFVNRIRKRFLLLLTATPVQNELKELYNMVTLLRPGQLRTYAHFRREFMLDRRTPKNPMELRSLLSPVLVRNTRKDTGIRFPERRVVNVSGVPQGIEKRLYAEALAFVRENYATMMRAHQHEGRRVNILPLVLLLREVCSSPRAAARTVAVMSQAVLSPPDPSAQVPYVALDRLEAMTKLLSEMKTTAKLDLLLEALRGWGDDKALVFTEFTETAANLCEELQAQGIATTLYHGGLSRDSKSEAIRTFRDRSRVMVSTEAGGEGHNLQFCRNVINFDLPWNPMRIEQRIGRVHRLGQVRDVRVVNLFLEGTVEAYVLYLLDKKIRMFEAVVGELDLILSGLGKRTFEGRLSDMVMSARDDDDMARMIEALGDQLEEARMTYERTKHMNSLLLD